MSFLDKIKGFMPIIQKGVEALPLPDNAVEKLIQINSLALNYALPLAKMVASTTPTHYDDQVVNGLAQLSLTLSELFNHTAGSKSYTDSTKQLLTKELLRDDLVKRVLAGEKIPFGQNRVLTTKEEVLTIPNSTLDAVVTSANAINKSQL